MILKKLIVSLVLTVVLYSNVQGASYSKVYLQNGFSQPFGFLNYGAPAVFTDPQLARISAGPVRPIVSLPSLTNLPPCVSPCTIPRQQSVAPLPNNAKIVTYDAPKVPVMEAPVQDDGYEYSYVVYDENTGDQKAQRESSDGGVVRGEYSFIQPDGYIREVQYTADDLTGFNVIVKSIPPGSVKSEDANKKDEPNPCIDTKKEALTVEPTDPTVDNNIDLAPEILTVIQAAATPEITEEAVTTVQDTTSEISSVQTVDDISTPEALPTTEIPQEITTSKLAVSETLVLQEPTTNTIVSYDDIIRCVQAKLAQRRPLNSNISPLTYIILPSNGRLC